MKRRLLKTKFVSETCGNVKDFVRRLLKISKREPLWSAAAAAFLQVRCPSCLPSPCNKEVYWSEEQQNTPQFTKSRL